MANRHLARATVLQSLFEWDFNKQKGNPDDILTRVSSEFAPDAGDYSFMEKLLHGVLAKKNELDAVIEKAAPDWPIANIAVIDRNVLRIGLFELLFSDKDEVPPKVAINEAIELAKTFGGMTSSKFVNGVLGAVYKEMGEPGKDQQSKKKVKIKNVDLPEDQLSVERLAGAIVYAENEGNLYLALVHDVFGHWTLSKGHIEEGEDVTAGVIREIKEELGLKIDVEETLGQNEYVAYDPEKGKIKKQVTYVLAKSAFDDLKLSQTGGLDDAKWFELKSILDLNFYDDILPLVTKAVQVLIKSR